MEDALQSSFGSARKAREFLERLRWPQGTVCPFCGSVSSSFRIQPGENSPTREGLWKCGQCRRQFTVTVGTLIEGLRMGLDVWLRGIAEICATSGEVRAAHLHRHLGLSYKSSLSLIRRVAAARREEPLKSRIEGKLNSIGEDSRGNRAIRGPLYPLDVSEAVESLLQIKPRKAQNGLLLLDQLGTAVRGWRLRPVKRLTTARR